MKELVFEFLDEKYPSTLFKSTVFGNLLFDKDGYMITVNSPSCSTWTVKSSLTYEVESYFNMDKGDFSDLFQEWANSKSIKH